MSKVHTSLRVFIRACHLRGSFAEPINYAVFPPLDETSIITLLLVVKLVPHVVVAVDALRHLDVYYCLRLLAGQSLRFGVPEGTAERASDTLGFSVCPHLEAFNMDVVATGGLAPSYLLAFGRKGHAADGAVIFDRFAVAVVGRFFHGLCWQSRCIVGNLLQLGSEEGVLLAKALRRFEDVVQDVKHLFAQGLVGIVALEARVWAAARRDVRDDDRVDIASRTGDLESVDGTVFMACVAVQFGALGAR